MGVVRVWRGDRADVSRVHNTACGGDPSRRDNSIGEEGARALAAALRESALTSLNLGYVRVVCVRVISRGKNEGRDGAGGLCA